LQAARITDEDVQSSQTLSGVSNQLHQERFITYIAWERYSFSAFLFDRRYNLTCVGLFVRVIIDSDIAAFSDKRNRRSLSQM
jgi:hypothetical protein